MSSSTKTLNPRTVAHVLPLAVFMAFGALLQLLENTGFTVREAAEPWYRRVPEQWVYPLQTLAALAVLWVFRKQYEFRPVRGLLLATATGLVGITIWILPGFLYQALEIRGDTLSLLGFVPREDGFNPQFIRDNSTTLHAAVIGMRFLRLVVAVPLVEEIFWRSFLMRYIADLDGDYWKVPFGTFRWQSFVVVTAAFTLAHQPDDYAAAAIYGSLTYWVAVRTRTLTACIVMHAVANLLLGLYTMWSGQWGYWQQFPVIPFC